MASTTMEIICLDTNLLIAQKRAKETDKNKTFSYRVIRALTPL